MGQRLALAGRGGLELLALGGGGGEGGDDGALAAAESLQFRGDLAWDVFGIAVSGSIDVAPAILARQSLSQSPLPSPR